MKAVPRAQAGRSGAPLSASDPARRGYWFVGVSVLLAFALGVLIKRVWLG